MIKIPKQIFFIWLGCIPPQYAYDSIQQFKNMNPDFDIKFIVIKDLKQDIYGFKTIMNAYWKYVYIRKVIGKPDTLIHRLLWLFHTSITGFKLQKYLSYTNIDKHLYAHISDAYRFYLLHKYGGGIYIDCDVLLIKKFDDKLLNLNSFRCKNDIYFLGVEPNRPFWFTKKWDNNKQMYIEDKNVIILPENNRWSQQDKECFFSLNFDAIDKKQYDDMYYIHHFCNRSWKF